MVMQERTANPKCENGSFGVIYSSPKNPSEKVEGAYCAPKSKLATNNDFN